MSNEFNFVVHPGKVIKKYLENINMSQKELANITRINKTVINEILSGKRNITISIALKLEPVFELPASYWTNMQNTYNERALRLKNKNASSYELKTSGKVEMLEFKKIEKNIQYNIMNCAV